MKTRTVGLVAALVMAASGVYAAEAQGAAKAAEPQGWKFEVTPYVWAAGLEGDIKVNGHKADFEKSFSDILDYVDVGGSFLAVAQYDRYLLWGQVDYFSLSTDALDIDDQPTKGKIDNKMLLTEAAVGYQVDGWMEGQTFDLLIGVRNLHNETDLEIYGKGKFSKDTDITDPLVLVRPSIPILPSKIAGLRFNPTLGIGAGGDADLVYELQPQFQYQITESIAARLGYRRVGYKFKGSGDNELNIALAGLIAGVGVTF